MSRRHMWPAVAVVVMCTLAVFLATSCTKRSPVAEDDAKATVPALTSETETIALETAFEPPVVEEIVEPIETKIQRAETKAAEIKSRTEVLRSQIFKEAGRRAETILCCLYRLNLIQGRPRGFYRNDPQVLVNDLEASLRGLGDFVSLRRSEEMTSPERVSKFADLTIPKATPYGGWIKPVSAANFRWVVEAQTSGFLTSDSVREDSLRLELEGQEWRAEPLERLCEPSYSEPIVSSPTAIRSSQQVMRGLIKESKARLREIPGVFDRIEIAWSRANDLQALIPSWKEDLASVDIDQVRAREAELDAALLGLDGVSGPPP